ncbi:phage tail assembly chaperone [Desulfosporosinus sp. Sb-LF]|uniref:phage tail assembly chaperone n=1 Tax=Desulfosporosinus sp. Sb-LF TaxID=2560027 RepID=UPI00249E7B8A|nr:phage tail assembly chaperone [Desulfosporosinus sp. Sb-LF]
MKKRSGGDELGSADWDWNLALRSAVQCGLMPEQFWDLTPAELNIIIEIHVEQKKDSQKSGIIAAFYSAYFTRLKTLSSPDLEKVLDGIDNVTGQDMTDEEMLNAVKKFAKDRG